MLLSPAALTDPSAGISIGSPSPAVVLQPAPAPVLPPRIVLPPLPPPPAVAVPPPPPLAILPPVVGIAPPPVVAEPVVAPAPASLKLALEHVPVLVADVATVTVGTAPDLPVVADAAPLANVVKGIAPAVPVPPAAAPLPAFADDELAAMDLDAAAGNAPAPPKDFSQVTKPPAAPARGGQTAALLGVAAIVVVLLAVL